MVKGLGSIPLALCFGGTFYAILHSSELGYKMLETDISTLTKAAGDILDACRNKIRCTHERPELAYVYGVIIIEERNDKTINLCVFGNRQVDRSPCGSGTTAIMALQHSLGKVRTREPRIFESVVTKSQFIGTVVEEHKSHTSHASVTVEIRGNGYYTGTCSFILEEDDLLGKGFLT